MPRRVWARATEKLFFKEFRLRRHSSWSGTRKALRRAHHAKYFHLGHRRARHVDTRAITVQIGRNELIAAIHDFQQLIHYNAFQAIAIAKREPQPQAFELRPAQE